MTANILIGDCRDVLPTLEAGSVQCCVTSPPYWGLRDYGHTGQIGQEKTPQEFVASLVGVFAEVWRVLKPDGTLWLNLGDSYAATSKGGGGTNLTTIGHGKGQATNNGSFYESRTFNIDASKLKPKDLVGIPWRVAFALQEAGWYLRSDIIWHKPNPMPESVTDRPTKSHEYLFLLTKSESYYYDSAAIAEPTTCDRLRGPASHGDTKSTNGNDGLARRPIGETRNKRSVWTVATHSYRDAHFATFPPALIAPCILAGSRLGDTILDPFGGSGTTGKVALELGRKATLIELNPEYGKLIEQRTSVHPVLAL